MTKRYWNLLILIVAIAGIAWIQATRIPGDAEIEARVAAFVNFQAPDFALAMLDGQSTSLSDHRGKIVLINFWATWCPPCRTEMQDIQAAAQAHPNDFVVLAVNNSEDIELVKPFIAGAQLTFPILLDTDGAVSRKYTVQGMPTSFFIDRAGIVRATYIGAMNRAYIEAHIAALEAR